MALFPRRQRQGEHGPPPERADWYMLASVPLGNGDDVGVATPWKWPDPFDGVTVHDLRRRKTRSAEGGPWRGDVRATAWVGKAIANALKLDPSDKANRTKIKGLLAKWIATGMFVMVEGKGDDRHETQFIKVGTWAND